jgi:hypothetical protein
MGNTINTKSKQYFRKVNKCGYRKDNKEGIGYSFNVVIPQPLVFALGIDKDSIMKFTIGKKHNYLRLEKV